MSDTFEGGILYTLICKKCEKEYLSPNKNSKFCSVNCFDIFYNRTIGKMKERPCLQCGKIFKPRNNAPNQIYCNRKCFEESHKIRMSGKNNPAYIDGRSKDPEHKFYRCDDWHEITLRVFKRDNYTCQSCGEKCVNKNNKLKSDKIIQCHHIINFFDGGDNSEENLITLCVSCHSKIHLKRK